MLKQRLGEYLERLPVTSYQQQNRFPRRSFLTGIGTIAAGFLLNWLSPGKIATAQPASTPGTTLNFVAHEDDDLLFLSPDLLHAIQSGRNVRTIFLTAGDNGETSGYWQGRQAGTEVAYAQMSGVANTWTQTDAGIAGHPIALFTLKGKPTVSLAYLHLPDGNLDGSGFASTNHESLQKLWTGSISTIHAIDGTSSYTKATLISTLASLMSSFLPDQVNCQDYVGTYGDGDHSDHHSVAYLVQTAQLQYNTQHTFTGYQDYIISTFAANVTGTDLVSKQNAFYAYGTDDPNTCNNASSCSTTNYALWLPRQYTVTGSTSGGYQAPIANAGSNQTVAFNATVQLDGSGSSASNGLSLTYTWTQTTGTTVTLSSSTTVKPTFTASASVSTLTFQLVVNDGQTSSSPATVTITVNNQPDLALSATVTASTQNTSTGQTANKAIDGVVDGYPGDYTKEWATTGGGAGSWLKLTWATAQTITRIVLYDRPNLNDQITGGTLQFSDGSSVAIGTLNNDGSAVTLSFAAKTVTSVQLTITSVSASTQNVGLAEIEAYSS